MQVDGVAMVTAHLATQHVDAVLHQQVEDVAQNANPVLAMDFDTHVGPANANVFQHRAEKL